MKFTIYGTPVETDDPAQIAEIFEMLKAEEEARKTPVDRAREAIKGNGGVFRGMSQTDPATAPGPETRQWLKDDVAMLTLNGDAGSVKSAVAVLEREEDLPAPAKMPKQVEVPPIAYVTQAQSLVVELLRHHPQGLSTKGVGEKLRWDGPRASRITTYLVRNESGALHPIVRKVPGHKRYVLTEYGRRCAFKVVPNPAAYRVFR